MTDIKINALRLKPLEWKDKKNFPKNCYDFEAGTFCYHYNIYRHGDQYRYECIPVDDVDGMSILWGDCDTIEESKQKCWEHWQESIQNDFATVLEV